MGFFKELQMAIDNGYNAAFIFDAGRVTYGTFSTNASIRRHARHKKAQIAIRLSPDGENPVPVYRAADLKERTREFLVKLLHLT